jgi:hypothetical protein
LNVYIDNVSVQKDFKEKAVPNFRNTKEIHEYVQAHVDAIQSGQSIDIETFHRFCINLYFRSFPDRKASIEKIINDAKERVAQASKRDEDNRKSREANEKDALARESRRQIGSFMDIESGRDCSHSSTVPNQISTTIWDDPQWRDLLIRNNE